MKEKNALYVYCTVYSVHRCTRYYIVEWFVLSMAHRCCFNTWKIKIIIVESVEKYSRIVFECVCVCVKFVCLRWWLEKKEHFIALKCYLIHRMPNSWFKTECTVVMAATAWVYKNMWWIWLFFPFFFISHFKLSCFISFQK